METDYLSSGFRWEKCFFRRDKSEYCHYIYISLRFLQHQSNSQFVHFLLYISTQIKVLRKLTGWILSNVLID